MGKKLIFYWTLYDFANSLVFITFLIHFSKWLVIENSFSLFWYNATFVIGSIGLLIFAPYLGHHADKNGGRKYLFLSTIGCFIFYLLTIIDALVFKNLVLAAILFSVGNFFYQISFVFYTPLLTNISNEKNQGRVSGIGFFGNYLGQIVGLLIALITIYFTEGNPNSLIFVLIPNTFLFIILTIPLIINKQIYLTSDTKNTPIVIDNANKSQGYLHKIKNLAALPGIILFMISFFLFSDALTTFVNNFSIYSSKIFNLPNNTISILTLIVIVFGSIGAWFWGIISDKFGYLKTMSLILILWVFVFISVALAKSTQFFYISCIFAGLCLGGSYPISRQILINLTPKSMLNYTFGWYSIAERAATFTGPLVWASSVYWFGYREAVLALAIIQFFSFIFMIKILINKRKKTIIAV